MDLDINGLRVLVTAGANGIGLAIARRSCVKARKSTPAMSTRRRCRRWPEPIPRLRKPSATCPTARP